MTHSGDHRLSKACRAILRGATRDGDGVREHVEACAFCAEWLQRREHLTGLLAQPVQPSAELRSPRMLESIRERIVESCEGSLLGQVLDDSMPVALAPEAEVWPDPDLVSNLADSGLASQIRTVNVGPPEWSDVRDSVLSGLSVRRAGRSIRNRVFASAGVVAAIVMCAILLREKERTEQPEIVFTDVASLAGVEFSPMSVLRNGGRR